MIFDATRTAKTGAQWGQFRIPLAVRVLDPNIKEYQNILTREFLTQLTPPAWCRRVNVLGDAGFAAKATLQHMAQWGYCYTFALPRTWKTQMADTCATKRFRAAAYQEQFDRSEVRFKKRLARLKAAL
jgi:hypothetical protein